MAIFGSKKKTTTKKAAEKATKPKKAAKPAVAAPAISTDRDIKSVVLGPRITEKGTVTIGTSNAYVFNVLKQATKTAISKEIERIYKVKPVKVAVVPFRPKTKFSRGSWGTRAGGKKAYVYLKKGDTIAII